MRPWTLALVVCLLEVVDALSIGELDKLPHSKAWILTAVMQVKTQTLSFHDMEDVERSIRLLLVSPLASVAA